MANVTALEKLLRGPALKPPTGLKSNLNDPKNPMLLWVYLTGVTCGTLATIAVVVRVYTKHFIIRQLGRDDWCTIFAWALWIVFIGTSSMAVHFGGGNHQWNVSVENLAKQLQWLHVSTIIYQPTTILVQASILLQYISLFVAIKKQGFVYWFCHALLWSIILFYIVSAFLHGFTCIPHEKIWKTWLPEGKCINRTSVHVAGAAFNSVTNIVIWILPQKAIWSLSLPTKPKIAVSAVFSVGLIACIATVTRLYFAILLSRSEDRSYGIIRFGIWTWVEIGVGLICSCAPTFPRWLRTVKPKFDFMVKTGDWVTGLSRHAREVMPESSKYANHHRINGDEESDRNILRGEISHMVGGTELRILNTGIIRTIHIETSEEYQGYSESEGNS